MLKNVGLTHGNAATMYDCCSGVLILIHDILVHIFHDKLVSVFGHPSVNESTTRW